MWKILQLQHIVFPVSQILEHLFEILLEIHVNVIVIILFAICARPNFTNVQNIYRVTQKKTLFSNLCSSGPHLTL